MSSSLPLRKREVIRALHDGEDLSEGDGPALCVLREEGYVQRDGTLSPKGEAEYRRILASGDGPEALKEMFRF